MQRRVVVTEAINWLRETAERAGLRSIAMVEAEYEVIGGKTRTQRRYFISSLAATAAQLLRSLAIENSLHWCLDVSFREDACRTRIGHAAENLAVVRHIALNLLAESSQNLLIPAEFVVRL